MPPSMTVYLQCEWVVLGSKKLPTRNHLCTSHNVARDKVTHTSVEDICIGCSLAALLWLIRKCFLVFKAGKSTSIGFKTLMTQH